MNRKNIIYYSVLFFLIFLGCYSKPSSSGVYIKTWGGWVEVPAYYWDFESGGGYKGTENLMPDQVPKLSVGSKILCISRKPTYISPNARQSKEHDGRWIVEPISVKHTIAILGPNYFELKTEDLTPGIYGLIFVEIRADLSKNFRVHFFNLK